MNVLALLNVAGGVANGIAVFDNILSALYIAQSILVTILKVNVYIIKLIY